MMLEPLPPRVQDHQAADVAAQALRIRGDLLQRLRGRLKEEVVHHALVDERETGPLSQKSAHVTPGSADDETNWVTTSMAHNSAKMNWTLEELGWSLRPPGDLRKWDGLMRWFLDYVSRSPMSLSPVPATAAQSGSRSIDCTAYATVRSVSRANRVELYVSREFTLPDIAITSLVTGFSAYRPVT